jgi:DnaJ-class molecular chaperone
MIRAAYRSLAQRFHPDKNQYSGAEERFKRIQAVYETLSDAEKRAQYEAFLAQHRAEARRQEDEQERPRAPRHRDRMSQSRWPDARVFGGVDVEESR